MPSHAPDRPRVALTIRPLLPDDPIRTGLPGVVIHWVPKAPPKRRKRKGDHPDPVAQYHRVSFAQCRDDGADEAPTTEAQATAYVRRAYAHAAMGHPIPSDAAVHYEVNG